MSDGLRTRAHNFVEALEQQLRRKLRDEERAALERIVAAKFGFDDDALRAAVEAERARCSQTYALTIGNELLNRMAAAEIDDRIRTAVEAERDGIIAGIRSTSWSGPEEIVAMIRERGKP